MAERSILIVEDESNIANLVKYNLEKSGFRCSVTANGEDGLIMLNKKRFDLIILDLMLPKMDGLEVCRCIKRNGKISSIPIIMLTARGEEMDRIVGFEVGAHDYVVKPFSPRELVLRVKAILNYTKTDEKKEDKLVADKLIVDISRHKVFVNSYIVNLTSMEFKLLVTLMQRKGRVQNRDMLLQDVWDINSDVTTRTVDTHIKCIRRKLGKMGKLIETVRNVGYRFCEVE